MDLSNLKPAKGSVKTNMRIGRGQGSAKGGTSGRGHNGQKSRSGYSKKLGFEGGQQPIQTRVPKFGFKNINRIEYKGVNLDTLQMLADDKKVKKVDKEVLRDHGLVSKHDLIKILGRGELKANLEITANAFSKSAKEAIEKAGGKAIELPGRRGKKENKPNKSAVGINKKVAVAESVKEPKAKAEEKTSNAPEEAKEQPKAEQTEKEVKDEKATEASAKAEVKVEEPKAVDKSEKAKEEVANEKA